MSAVNSGTVLGNLPRFLMEILGEVNTLDAGSPNTVTQAKLSNYAARVDSLAEAEWQRNPIPGDVKFGLEAIGTSLRILAGELTSDNQDREQDIQDCKRLIIDCGQKTEKRINEIRQREIMEADTMAEERQPKRKG